MYITEHERAENVSWIDASAALHLAMQSNSNERDAREFLIRRAGANRILTRCRFMRCETRGARTRTVERDDCLISFELWQEYGAPERRTLADWSSGDFERTKTSAKGARDVVSVLGVQFSKEDLIAELPKPAIEWVPASVAFEVLDRADVSDLATAICSRAYEGLVRARAQKFTWENGPRGGGKKKFEASDCDLPPEFWWAKGYDALECNWDTGDFSTWIDRTYEWKAFGVQFARSDIEAMLPRRTDRTDRADHAVKEAAAEASLSAIEAATPRSRNLSHDHPYASAMAALSLTKLGIEERERLTGPSIGKTMEAFYRARHKSKQAPHQDNLDDFGASVLAALREFWAASKS